MSLVEEYRRQAEWRSWSRIFETLPPMKGQHVLDLGCGPGDQALELTARGARVVGIDSNEELLDAARARDIEHAEFRSGDIRALPDFDVAFDGIWCSFGAAYLPDLSKLLPSWMRLLRRTGWIALIEVDDLLGHEPLSRDATALLAAYAAEAVTAGRYDFHMGRKLPAYLSGAGLQVSRFFAVPDRELSFTGPADADVLEAWEQRLDRMKLLKDFCGTAYTSVRAEFSACLQSPDHRSRAQVYCCLAGK